MKTIKIEAGEFCVLIVCEDAQIIKSIDKVFGHFASNRKPDFTLTLKVYPPNDYERQVRKRIDIEGNSCTVPIMAFDKGHMQTTLRSIFSVICSENNAFLLHSAGIIDEKNQAQIFCGPPEAGKSTISALSTGYTLLSDDCLVIKKTGKKFMAFGTSLGGEYLKYGKSLKPNNISAPVGNIFFIKQANEHKVEVKEKSRAMAEILNEAITYKFNHPRSAKLIAATFKLIYNFCQSTDCYNLYFKKDKDFWKHIEKLK